MNECPACAELGHVCALCQCGLTPLPGLNPKFVIQLAKFMLRGAEMFLRQPGENVLACAARLVRERDAFDRDYPSARMLTERAPVLVLGGSNSEHPHLSAGVDGVTSEMLDELYARGELEVVATLDSKIMCGTRKPPSRLPSDSQPPTKREGSRPAPGTP